MKNLFLLFILIVGHSSFTEAHVIYQGTSVLGTQNVNTLNTNRLRVAFKPFSTGMSDFSGKTYLLFTDQEGYVGYYPNSSNDNSDGSILMIKDYQPTWVSKEEAFGEVAQYVTQMASEIEALKAELQKLKAEIETLKKN
jgi:hypothetical protein